MAGTSSRNNKRAKVTMKKVSGRLTETALMGGGVYVGQLLNNVLKNAMAKFIPQAGTTAGLGGVTNFITPAALAIIGVVAPEYLKLGANGKYSRSIGNGIATYGVIKSANEILGKDVLAGRLNGMGFFKTLREPYPRARIPANFAFPDLKHYRNEHATDTRWQHQMAL